MPDVIGWDEAARLVQQILTDPTAHITAAVEGWKYPASRETLALFDLYDLQRQSKSKRRQKPRERPWDIPPKTYGAGSSMTPDEWRALRERASQN